MPRIHLCFLWHMHQPFYKDLVSGEYKLPWTRMHALKDYYGMVRILEEFPAIRQTFNLVPSMMVQVEEYAAGEANDPFLHAALKPAEALTDADQRVSAAPFLLFRSAAHDLPLSAIRRAIRSAQGAEERLGRHFSACRNFAILQMWSQLAWFDEEFQEHDPEVARLDQARARFYARPISAAWAKSSARS